MQNSNQPLQQTDKNKGDQSAVEQQQKEQTGKNPSPENMSGAQNAQQGDQADQQVTGQKQHITNNDGAAVNATDEDEDQVEGKMGNQQQKTMGSKNMGNQDQDNKGGRQNREDEDNDGQNRGNKGNMGSNQGGQGGQGGQQKNQGR